MASVPYLAGGQPLSYRQINALAAEANARLLKAYAGCCPAMLPLADIAGAHLHHRYQRVFFFYGSIAVETPTTAAEAVAHYYGDGDLNNVNQGPAIPAQKRAYTHSVFTDWVAAAEIAELGDGGELDTRPIKDDSKPCLRLRAPSEEDWPALAALIYPEGDPGTLAFDLLKLSLQVHKRTYEGKEYYVYVDGCDEAEHVHEWEPADIILGDGFGAAYDWPVAYDKYRLLRFNNCQPFATTIRFQKLDSDGAGTGEYVSLEIAAFGSMCIRSYDVAGGGMSWEIGWEYFHKLRAGDPWWYNKHQWGTVTDPFGPAGMLWLVKSQVPGLGERPLFTADPAQWWNAAATYFGEGKKFGAIDGATKLGDLMFHRGDMMVVNASEADSFAIIKFAGMDTLAAVLATAGVDLTYPDPEPPDGQTHSILVSSENDLDWFGLGTNIVKAMFGSYGVKLQDGAHIPALQFNLSSIGIRQCPLTESAITASKNNWTWDGSDEATLAITGTTSYSVPSSRVVSITYAPLTPGDFSLFHTAQELIDAIEDRDPAGRNTVTATLKATAFGPLLLLDEQIDASYPIDDLNPIPGAIGDAVGTLFEYTAGSPPVFHRVSVVLLGKGWPPVDYALNAGLVPPNYLNLYSVIFPGTEMSWNCWRYAVKPAVMRQMFADPTAKLGNQVKEYWENAPFSERRYLDLPGTTTTGGVRDMAGIYQLAQQSFNNLTGGARADFSMWARLSAWAYFRRLDYIDSYHNPAVFDCTPGAYGRSVWYGLTREALTNGTAFAAEDEYFKHALPISVGQYNAAASHVNGVTKRMGTKFLSPMHRVTPLFTHIAASKGYGLGTRKYRPRNQAIGWDDNDNPERTAFFEDLGLEILTKADFPDWGGFETTNVLWHNGATTSEDFSAYGYPGVLKLKDAICYNYWATTQSYVDNYRWITITALAAYFASKGLPFVFEELAVPCNFVLETATAGKIGTPGNTALGGSWGVCSVRMANFIQIPSAIEDSDWVFDPENNIMRAGAALEATDYSIAMLGAGDGSFGDYGLYKIEWSDAMAARLYYVDANALSYISPAQAIKANYAMLYRRYGGRPGKAIFWPRNYVDYVRNQSSTYANAAARWILASYLWDTLDRVEVDDLEGSDIEATPLTEDETIFACPFENAEMRVWHEATSLVS
jgi:hypothetical protein